MSPRRSALGHKMATPSTSTVDANAVVSYNVRAIRERRGWTQQYVAERLATLTDHLLPQASISAMERGFDGERRRRFDAHELYLLSKVFDVPIAYFFVPPPPTVAAGRVLANTGGPLADLYAAFLGHLTQLPALDERLTQADLGDQESTERVLGALFGATHGARGWMEHYRAWRRHGLDRLADGWGEELLAAAATLTKFAQGVQALHPEAFLADQAASGVGGVQRERP